MKTTEYIVYRHGSNAANQSLCQRLAVGVFDGAGRTATERRTNACARASAWVTVYNNQHLTAKPLSRASIEDRSEAADQEECRAVDDEEYADDFQYFRHRAERGLSAY